MSTAARSSILLAAILTALAGASGAESPPAPATSISGYDLELRKTKLGPASVLVEGNELVVSTGRVQGRWKWTGEDLVTSGLKDLKTGYLKNPPRPLLATREAVPGVRENETG